MPGTVPRGSSCSSCPSSKSKAKTVKKPASKKATTKPKPKTSSCKSCKVKKPVAKKKQIKKTGRPSCGTNCFDYSCTSSDTLSECSTGCSCSDCISYDSDSYSSDSSDCRTCSGSNRRSGKYNCKR